MRSGHWHLTADVEDFLARAGAFLRSRPDVHTMPLSVTAKLRTPGGGSPGAVFGLLEQAGEVRATCYRLPAGGLSVTALTPEQADTLAAHLAALGHAFPSVGAERATAAAFAEAWQRHTGATPALRVRRLR
ncbi:hypothetical protein [Actinoplanes palleronii]|uniref:GNAT family N-acetyltransferase n=1 Tax=Actinoplanes palleronii TaxID=113570 RepID=A0ABQ4BT48_9ACTN|nr:hypothetical protein [Actinoplanes palleronii]GIE73857.1 hypothetical protein Apa02nite_099650 [Actinoplanes palleronii]